MTTKLPRLIAASLALALALPAPLAFAQEKKSTEEHTELEEKMEKMQSAWRRLRRQVNDPAQNTSSLELVATIREASKGADKLTPAKAAEVPEADRAKFQADYEAGMKKLFEQLDTLEAALKAGKNDEAGQAVNAIAEHQKSAHKSFRKAPAEKK